MRESLVALTKPIRERLKKYEEIKDDVNTLVPIEVMAVGCQMMGIHIPLGEAWTLLTGYDFPVIPSHANKGILDRIRILLSSYSGETGWNNVLDEYFELPEQFRLLNKDEEGDVFFSVPRFDPGRKEQYEKLLNRPIPLKASDKKFVKAEKFFYKKIVNQNVLTFSGEIPVEWIEKPKFLQGYRKKRRVQFHETYDWLTVAKEMDDVLDNGKHEWEDRIRPIGFQSVKEEKVFHYEGLQHIGGGLASGKSTFRIINTYWLAKNKGARVGIIEENIAQVLEQVNTLRALGINAVPIIGRSNRQLHLENYLQSNTFTHLTDISSHESLSYLSNQCMIRALAEDYDDNQTYFPCEHLKTENQQSEKLCPLANQCGIYKDWAKLVEADVWVTTSAAVLKTRLPAMIDPYKRYIYEAMYDLLDVIFVDEADQVQKQFDETFLEEYDAFGSTDYLVEKLDEQFTDNIRGRYNLADNTFITDWQTNLNHLTENVWNLLGEIKVSRILRESLKNQVVYLNYLIFEIADIIAVDETHRKEITDTMRDFTRDATFLSMGFSNNRLHQLVRVSKNKDKQEIIDVWLQEVGGIVSKQTKISQLYAKIECFVYLSHIESALKYINLYFPLIQQFDYGVSIPVLHSFRDFRPFMKESMTGVMFGYRYVPKQDEIMGDFKIVQYVAVGQELLYKWPTIYKEADHKQGPAVILLSGTSYAPESLHYHIEHEPEWMITSTRQQSNIKQTLLELRDPQFNEEIINVSGVSQKDNRHRNLQVMVKELTSKIESERSYWKEQGENRRILLVVNSYEDVEVVGDALKQIDIWQGKYRLLTKSNKKDDRWFPRSKIEHFSDEKNATILVAPLLAISRGYNIMDGSGALFGTAFFLIRPYPVPNDLSYFIQVLHGYLPVYQEESVNNGLKYLKAMRHLRMRSRARFESMYRRPDFWSVLNEKERIVLAWYTFIPVWQLIGRLLRGGKDARIFYCDGKFNNGSTEIPSLLQYWEKIMFKNKDVLFKSLYGPFIESISSTLKQKEM